VTQSPPLAQVSIDQVAEPPDLGVAGIAVEDHRLFELGTASGQAAMGDEMTAIDMDLGIGMGGQIGPPVPPDGPLTMPVRELVCGGCHDSSSIVMCPVSGCPETW
jgi:hypothetical protein